MSKHEIGSPNGLAVGAMHTQVVEGTPIVVYRLSDGYYATQARCPHLRGPLANGEVIDDRVIQCPFHRARFDIRSGEVVKWANFPPGIQVLNPIRQSKPLVTYPVTEEDGRLYVEI